MCPRIDGPVPYGCCNLWQPACEPYSHAAAHHDHVRLQQINDIAQPRSQDLCCLLNHPHRPGFSCISGVKNGFRRNCTTVHVAFLRIAVSWHFCEMLTSTTSDC